MPWKQWSFDISRVDRSVNGQHDGHDRSAGQFTKADSHILHCHMRFIAGFISIHAPLKCQTDRKNTTMACFDWPIAS